MWSISAATWAILDTKAIFLTTLKKKEVIQLLIHTNLTGSKEYKIHRSFLFTKYVNY